MEIKHFISHRGNISGAQPDSENTKNYILNALDNGYECEIDVWYQDNNFYLGHDKPSEKIEQDFLFDHKEHLWIHCKNLEGLQVFNTYDTLNFFWHENDKFTLTSKGYIWTYPGNLISKKSVIVSLGDSMPDEECYGICSDYVEKFK